MTMNTMRELLVHELRDLYGAEQQLVKALPKLADAASSTMLSTAFRDHLGQTESHVLRIEECLSLLGEEKRAIKCKGMEGLLKEGTDMADGSGNPLVRDAGLVGAAQRVEHYEMAAYGTCVELARVLGEDPVADLLRQSLEEERGADAKLSEIANTDVNPKAMLSAVAVS